MCLVKINKSLFNKYLISDRIYFINNRILLEIIQELWSIYYKDKKYVNIIIYDYYNKMVISIKKEILAVNQLEYKKK